MRAGDHQPDQGPNISLQQISLASGPERGVWLIAWRVENLDERPLRIDAARFPHSQFKAGEQTFRPAIVLGRGEGASFESTVMCAEPPGASVENAFIIFSAVWMERRWRIFVRLRIMIDDGEKPTAITELITTQPVGFSTELRPED